VILDRLHQSRNADLLPNIFTSFFSRPLLSYTIQGSDTEGDFADKIRYHEVSNRNIDLLASFSARITISLQRRDRKWHNFKHPAIRASILGDEIMRECCNLINNALETYRDGLPCWWSRISRVWPNLDPSGLEKMSQALFYFLSARYVGIDRYCKRAIILERRLLPSSLVNSVRSLVGRTKETSLPLFDNIPYLRRFRLRDGSFFISSDYLPEPPHRLMGDSTKNILRDVSVDTMLLGVDMVLWLRIDKSDPPFDATGHYPILAGTNQRGGELYVAAAKVDGIYYLTCVEDGAKFVTYTDEIGDEHVTKIFYVLALRHDPSDATPPYPRTPAGAMDPTGPLHWLKFWPEEDPDSVALSDSARIDDNHLESLLNGFDGNTKKDVDIWWWG